MEFSSKVNFDNLKQKSPQFGKKTKIGIVSLVAVLFLSVVIAVPELGEIEVTNDPGEQEDDEPVLVIAQTYDASILDMAFADFVGCDTPTDSDQEINCDVKWSSIVDFGDSEEEDPEEGLEEQLDEQLGDIEGDIDIEDLE